MQLGINGSPWTCFIRRVVLGSSSGRVRSSSVPLLFQKHQNSIKQHVTQAFPSDMPYARKFPEVLEYGILI